MTMSTRTFVLAGLGCAVLLSAHARATRADRDFTAPDPMLTVQDPQQPVYELGKITGTTGARTRLAVQPFAVPGADAATQTAAKTIAQVLWDDIDFEGEFYMVPPAEAAKIAAAAAPESLPIDRWSQLGADAVIMGTEIGRAHV